MIKRRETYKIVRSNYDMFDYLCQDVESGIADYPRVQVELLYSHAKEHHGRTGDLYPSQGAGAAPPDRHQEAFSGPGGAAAAYLPGSRPDVFMAAQNTTGTTSSGLSQASCSSR